MTALSINTMPLWGVCLFTVLMVLGSIACGYWAGTVRRKGSDLSLIHI